MFKTIAFILLGFVSLIVIGIIFLAVLIKANCEDIERRIYSEEEDARYV